MSITMQGSWTVSVKSKNAANPQRFVIHGAASGNGTYAGNTATSAVHVTGSQWTIQVQSDPGSGFVDSQMQYKFPTSSGGVYSFDIQTNDTGPDADFNDLILTCSTPVTATDFLLFGNVQSYTGCLINPCYRRYIVIESQAALLEAIRNPAVLAAVKTLYPDRLLPRIPPIPLPDPPPFRPMVLPVQEETALPNKRAQVLSLLSDSGAKKERSAKASASAPVEALNLASSTPVRTVSISSASQLVGSLDRARLGDWVDKVRRFCDTEPLAGYVLKFLEYDRSSAELAGGPYTGDGSREYLGVTTTDRNGNYIFRFTRTIAQFLEEADVDVATGENELVQVMPDVIIQLVDTITPTGILYESAPFWNIPVFKRIDLCIPADQLRRPITACQGTRAIQAIGNIKLINTAHVHFDSQGRVTCDDTSRPDIPQTQCAAWSWTLTFSGCFLDHPDVTQYTLQHRHKVGSAWSGWDFYQETLNLFNVTLLLSQPVGPWDRNLEVNGGGSLVAAKAYDNIEKNFNWAASDWFIKAVVTTSLGTYTPAPGPVQFRLQGYNASGHQVSGANDLVTLYIDNSGPDLQIASVAMGTQTGGECALFDLSGEPVPAVITVRFKAIQEEGFLKNYKLWVRKGNSVGEFSITTTTGPALETSGALSRSYTHTGSSPCAALIGTRPPDEPLADSSDFVTAYVIPSTGNWLATGQNFCTFAINLEATVRRTNGYNAGEYTYGNGSGAQYLLGIQA